MIGDLVSVDGNENLVYLGCIDCMVKCRGYCIELVEIEVGIIVYLDIKSFGVIVIVIKD